LRFLRQSTILSPSFRHPFTMLSSHSLQEIEKSSRLAWETLERCSSSTVEFSSASDKIQRLYATLVLIQSESTNPLSALSLCNDDDQLSGLIYECQDPLMSLNSLILTHQRLGIISERHWDNFGNTSLANIERDLLRLLVSFDTLLTSLATL
jgi:hypothetical protein